MPKVEIKKSENFEDMYAIFVDGKVYDEPIWTIKKALNRAKKFGFKDVGEENA